MRKQKRRKGKPGIILIIVLVLIAAVVAVLFLRKDKEPEEDTRIILEDPRIESSLTIGATGDILIHSPIIDSVYYGGGYDFSDCFRLVAPYYSQPDIMIANLEVTCGGEEAGAYSGYPTFNCPDNIIPTLKNAGVDLLLTANNHSYDTGYAGMIRTLDLITENGLEYLGTRKNTGEHFIIVKEVNGIKIGMINFTYDTRQYPDDQKSLNGIPMLGEAEDLVSSFCYEDLEELYRNVKDAMHQMNMLGVDSKIVFIHWGNEYQDDPNWVQEEIAQEICELGADVIIGGHPHVIQRYDTLTASNGHQTLCLYSMGNELSNQRASLMDEDGNRGYTEDGLIFEVTYSKFNNRKVKITGLKIVPTWVERTGSYSIVALDDQTDPYSWGADNTGAALSSYERTIGRLGWGYNAFRASRGQAAVPEYLN